MKRAATILGLTAVLAFALPGVAVSALGGKTVLQPFYHGVTLDGGRLRQQVEEVRAYYLRVPNETLMPRDALSATLLSARNHFETQCGSWAGFKLTKYLLTCTGARKLLALGFTKEKARVCAFNGRGAWPREVFPLRHGARVFPLLHGAGGMPGLST